MVHPFEPFGHLSRTKRPNEQFVTRLLLKLQRAGMGQSCSMPSLSYTPSTRRCLILDYRPAGGNQSTTVRISIVSACLTSTDVIASSPGSRMSPALTSPIQFRTSDVDACDHSECFLFSYDLHRLYHEQDRRPRILINPQVRVAYEKTWYHWNNVFLRRPIIRWWLGEYFTREGSSG